MDQINKNTSFNYLFNSAESSDKTQYWYPKERPENAIESLNRENFNLKLERFLLQEELKKNKSNFKPDDKGLLKTLRDLKKQFNRLQTELEEKNEALKEAYSIIERREQEEKRLYEQHATKMKILLKKLEKYQNKVSSLKSKLDKRDETLVTLRLKRQKKLNKKKEKNQSSNTDQYAETFVLPSRVIARVSAYRKKIFRVKFLDVTLTESNENKENDENKSQQSSSQKHNIESGHNEIAKEELLEMILKWIIMRDCKNHTELLENMESMGTVNVVSAKESHELINDYEKVSNNNNANSYPISNEPITTHKLNPLMKLILMPFYRLFH